METVRGQAVYELPYGPSVYVPSLSLSINPAMYLSIARFAPCLDCSLHVVLVSPPAASNVHIILPVCPAPYLTMFRWLSSRNTEISRMATL